MEKWGKGTNYVFIRLLLHLLMINRFNESKRGFRFCVSRGWVLESGEEKQKLSRNLNFYEILHFISMSISYIKQI